LQGTNLILKFTYCCVRFPGKLEQLSAVQEDRVDLDHQGDGGVGHVGLVDGGNPEAGDDRQVVDQHLLGRPLVPGVEEHVKEVVEEVSDGKAHKGVRRISVAPWSSSCPRMVSNSFIFNVLSNFAKLLIYL